VATAAESPRHRQVAAEVLAEEVGDIRLVVNG
jgi:hypothetical protein